MVCSDTQLLDDVIVNVYWGTLACGSSPLTVLFAIGIMPRAAPKATKGGGATPRVYVVPTVKSLGSCLTLMVAEPLETARLHAVFALMEPTTSIMAGRASCFISTD